MSIGHGLIKALLRDSVPLAFLQTHNIDRTHFIQGSERRAFDFLYNYIMEFNGFPQLETVALNAQAVTEFNAAPDEPVEFWINEIRERERYRILNNSISSIRGLLEQQNAAGAIEALGSAYLNLRSTYGETRILELADAEHMVLERHQEIRDQIDLPGIPCGFPFFDNSTGGAQGGDCIIIIGETGVGKSYLLFKNAISAWEAGYNVLCLSTEMSELQVARRLLAMRCGISTTNLKMGRLSWFAENRARNLINIPIEIDGERQSNYFKLLPGGMYAKVEDVILVTKELQPDILLIDGAYLLRMPRFKGSRWERVIEVMDMLKELSLSSNIPIIQTYQYGKQRIGKLDGVYGGMAISQVASVAYSLEYERKEDLDSTNPIQYRVLKLIKGRDGESGTVRVCFNTLKSRLTQQEVLSGFDPQEEPQNEDFFIDMDLCESI